MKLKAIPVAQAVAALILAGDNLLLVRLLIELVVAFAILKQQRQQAKLLAELDIVVPNLARETLKVKLVAQLVAGL